MEDDNESVPVFVELEARLAQEDPRDQLKLNRDRRVIVVMLVGVVLTVPSMLGANWGVAGLDHADRFGSRTVWAGSPRLSPGSGCGT